MIVDPKFIIHDLDKSALQSLKTIPGFTKLLKSFMKTWNEQLFNIENMSTNLRISEKQLPKYHNMLPPICELLGIDIPEIYLKLDVTPNAYTYGITDPFIVITSGLIEALPEELIPTVIAHECGHIACHHTLFTTMGNLLLGGASEAIGFFGLGDIVLLPIKAAFWHWMRCSEYSADRAAMVYDGNADKTIEVCLRFSGLDKSIAADANVEAFIEQAVQYKELADSNKISKAMELFMFIDNAHPLNAVRAYECNEWQKSESFFNIVNYVNGKDTKTCEKLPLTDVSDRYIGKDCLAVEDELGKAGFTNVKLIRKIHAVSKKSEPSQVVEIAIDGKTKLEDADWYSRDSIIEVSYYLPESEEEIAAAHPGEIRIPNSSKGYYGKNYKEVVTELRGLGFTNISTYKQKLSIIGRPRKEYCIARMTIDGKAQFDIGNWYSPDAVIKIVYIVTR